MSIYKTPKHRGALRPLLVVTGSIALFAWGVIALISQDGLWFLSRVEVPDPVRIVIRIDGAETVLTDASPGYGAILKATREALSSFKNWAPGSMGLSPMTLEEYESAGTLLELYFDEPLDFRMPFNDGRPTALLIPIAGRYGGEGHVFRGRGGRWWSGQLTMSDPEPINEVLAALGYLEQ